MSHARLSRRLLKTQSMAILNLHLLEGQRRKGARRFE
jgi:hypothetical protein